MGELEASIAVHRKAVNLAPENIGALNNMGTSEQSSGMLDEAIRTFERTLELDRSAVITKINLATVLMERNDIDRAIPLFEEVVETASFGDETPEHALAHKNLGLSLMLKGEFDTGAKHYAWRWATREFTPRDLTSPVWAGEELNGESVFVHWEQGFGDAVQFARFAAHIRDRGGRPILEVPAPLAPLLKTANGIEDIVIEGTTPPETDLHIPMFDLLGALSVSSQNLPGTIPYLKVDPDRGEQWSDRIPETGRLRVGLVWAGRPTHRNDRNRSIPLEAMLPLLRQTDVDFYALQVGERVSEIATAGLANDLIDLSPRLSDFAETAAALDQLDLLISVDTSVVHVAGAINRPAWVLIPHAPDWRWGLEDGTSPWYPSLRLWRQPEFGDWDTVLENIAETLRAERKTLRRR